MPEPPAPLRARLLGPPRLTWQGAEVTIRSRKEAALVWHLALRPDGVAKEALAELLWGPDRRGNLRVALHHLRRRPGAEAWLGRDDPLTLRVESDVAAFLGRADDDPEAALATWADRPEGVAARAWPLHGVDLPEAPAYADWLEVERERLAARWTAAALAAAERAEQEGRYADATRWCRHLLADDPLHETATRALMRSAWLLGDREGAVAAYERCRRALAEELGLEPLEETRDLLARLRATPPTPRAPRVAPRPDTPTRAQDDALVGRAAERARVLAALAPGRLVTLTGPGGIGKTHLADAVATAWPGPVARVALGALVHDGDVAPALLGALGGEARRGATAVALPEALAGWSAAAPATTTALLVLDETESVAGGAVAAVEAARAVHPAPAVLATSRVELDVPDEAVVRLDGLPEADAMALFERLVAERAPGFALAADEREAAGELVRTLGGSPLALTLAASWVPEVTVAEVAAGVGVGLARAHHGRAPAAGDHPDRHGSLRAALDHSWLLLSDPERAVLAALAPFPAAFDGDAAAAVAGAERRTLLALVRKSMLQRDRAGRYRLHPVVRLYAAEALERLDEADAAHDRHAAWALGPLLAGLRRPGPTWVVEPEAARRAFDDLRAAWDRRLAAAPVALDGVVEAVAAVVDQLGRWRDADAWFARAEAHPAVAAQPALRAALGVARARAAGVLDGAAAELAHLDRVADDLPDAAPRTQAEAHRVRGHALLGLGTDHAVAAEAALERAADAYAALGDDRAWASTLNLAGLVARDRRDAALAAERFGRVLAAAERAGLPVARGAALANLATVQPPDRPLTERVALLEGAAAALREAAYAPGLAAALLNLGRRRREVGLPGARAAFEEALALQDGLGLPTRHTLVELAEEEDGEGAAALATRALTAAREAGDALTEALAAKRLALLTEADGDRDAADAAFAQAADAAARGGPVARVNVHRARAHARWARGDRAGARRDLAEALAAALEARLDTTLWIAAEAARWLGPPADAATAALLRGAVAHARVLDWAPALASLREAATELGIDAHGGPVDGPFGAFDPRTPAVPGAAVLHDAVRALVTAAGLPQRLVQEADAR